MCRHKIGNVDHQYLYKLWNASFRVLLWISDLMRGKINLFALDILVNMTTAAGLHVEMRITKIKKAA